MPSRTVARPGQVAASETLTTFEKRQCTLNAIHYMRSKCIVIMLQSVSSLYVSDRYDVLGHIAVLSKAFTLPWRLHLDGCIQFDLPKLPEEPSCCVSGLKAVCEAGKC